MAKQKTYINKEIQDEKIKLIKEALEQQLSEQNKYGKQFEDMIEDYIYLVRLKEELQEDIKIKGIRYRIKSGNGFSSNKPNESILNLLKVNNQMLKILQDLDMKAPDPNKVNDENDLLQ